MQKINLNLGCGIGIEKGYINIDNSFSLQDLEEGVKTKKGVFSTASIAKGAEFIQADIRKLPFKDNYADFAELHQVIEHIPMRDVIPVLTEIRRVLKKNAKLLLSTPSFNGLCLEWLHNQVGMKNKEFDVNQYLYLAQEFYGMQTTEGEYHRCPITPDFITYCAGQAGFSNGIMNVYPRNFPIPKDLGLISKYGKNAVFRSETIVVELTK